MTLNKKNQIFTLLKGIETGDPAAVTVVNESKYIQHNPLTREGNVGLAELFKRLSKTSPRVTIVRIFEDGFAVEYWDNLQHQPCSPNLSGHTMIDGPTEVTNHDRTEENRQLVRSFFDEVLVSGQLDSLDYY